MQTVNGPKLLEYNARFGDPEAQALFPLLDDASDLADIMIACTEAQLERVHMEFQRKAAVSLVVASSGYLGAYRVGEIIDFGALPQGKKLSPWFPGYSLTKRSHRCVGLPCRHFVGRGPTRDSRWEGFGGGLHS
jgi:phosphoribosylamine-glycine ligase